MSLEIPISIVKVKETIIQEVDTNKIKIKGVYFDLEKTESTAIVVFGNKVNNKFIEKKQENWKLSKNFYYSAISLAPQGNSIGEALLKSIENTIKQIQSDSILKQKLIDSQELVIS